MPFRRHRLTVPAIVAVPTLLLAGFNIGVRSAGAGAAQLPPEPTTTDDWALLVSKSAR